MGTHQVAWTYNTLAFARSIPSPSNDSILASLGVRGRRRDGRLFLPGRMKGCISFFHVGAARTIDDESLHLSWGAASARPTPPRPHLDHRSNPVELLGRVQAPDTKGITLVCKKMKVLEMLKVVCWVLLFVKKNEAM